MPEKHKKSPGFTQSSENPGDSGLNSQKLSEIHGKGEFTMKKRKIAKPERKSARMYAKATEFVRDDED